MTYDAFSPCITRTLRVIYLQRDRLIDVLFIDHKHTCSKSKRQVWDGKLRPAAMDMEWTVSMSFVNCNHLVWIVIGAHFWCTVSTFEVATHFKLLFKQVYYRSGTGICCCCIGACVCTAVIIVPSLFCMKWRDGRHVESVTLNRKSNFVNRRVFIWRIQGAMGHSKSS